jgi:deoxyribose-phosphate aldolase
MTKQEFAKTIDHTILKPNATFAEIEKLCSEARQYRFASCCVNPYYVKMTSDLLVNTGVLTCAVIGFPLGANITNVKIVEAELAMLDGAKEIDMVINIAELVNCNYNYVFNEIKQLAELVHQNDSILKVIVETCLLNTNEKIEIAKIVSDASADFIKTSTGFSSAGATTEDIVLFKNTISPKLKIKASGGIRSLDFALELINAGANRIGTSSGIKLVEDFI